MQTKHVVFYQGQMQVFADGKDAEIFAKLLTQDSIPFTRILSGPELIKNIKFKQGANRGN